MICCLFKEACVLDVLRYSIVLMDIKSVHPSGNQAQDDPAPKQCCRDERRMNGGGKEIDDEHDGSQKV